MLPVREKDRKGIRVRTQCYLAWEVVVLIVIVMSILIVRRMDWRERR